MEAKELNRQIKATFKAWMRLREEFRNIPHPDDIDYREHETQIQELKSNMRKLYRVDPEFEYINHKNVLRLIRMNLSTRFEQLHNLGIYIDENKLV